MSDFITPSQEIAALSQELVALLAKMQEKTAVNQLNLGRLAVVMTTRPSARMTEVMSLYGDERQKLVITHLREMNAGIRQLVNAITQFADVSGAAIDQIEAGNRDITEKLA